MRFYCAEFSFLQTGNVLYVGLFDEVSTNSATRKTRNEFCLTGDDVLDCPNWLEYHYLCVATGKDASAAFFWCANLT